MLQPEVWILEDQDGWAAEAVHHINGQLLGFFECDHMPFRLCNMPATFQRLMQNCPGELNLTYCLIYLDDIIIFSQTAEEHLHHLHIIFDKFTEHNPKLKPSKCNFLGMKSPT